MAYTKTTWQDEVLSGTERFDIKTDGGTPVYETMQIVLAATRTVTTVGTSLNATNMNKIEQGIYDVADEARYLRSTGGSLPTSGTGAVLMFDGSRTLLLSINGATQVQSPMRIQGNPIVLELTNAAPTDSWLMSSPPYGSMVVWANQSSNLLIFRVKYSDGTLKTGTIALS